MGKYHSKSRGGLSPQQSQTLIDSIRANQIENEGLTKKAVVEKAFRETFGKDVAAWPIKLSSSAVVRYWRFAFPSGEINIGKQSIQPLLDDLREPHIPVVPLDCVFHSCPWCQKPIRALVVAAATVLKHEQQG